MKTILSALIALFFTSVTFAQSPDLASLIGNKVDAAVVPNAYNFSWKYTMEIQTDSKTLNADYLLEKDAPYFGVAISQAGNNVLMVMDTKNKINVTTFGTGAQKMAMASKQPDYSDVAKKEGGERKFVYKSLPEKTILGYKCKGIEATDADYVMVFYFTNDAPVSFADLFKSPIGKSLPNAFSGYFKPGEKPLLMSIDINDKAKAKNTKMHCVSLEKSAFVFKKADYKFM